MAIKISNAVVNTKIRSTIFDALGIAAIEGFHKIDDCQYGCIVEDDNGDRRYARVKVVVAALRDDMSADALMQAEINQYNTTQAEKAEKAEKRKEKAAKDKAKREAAKKEEEG